MKKSTIVVVLIAILALSCSPRKILVSSSSTDSVAISREKEYIERWRIDTVIIELPGASVEQTVRDSISLIIKNNIRTTAKINYDGSLYHDLIIDSQKLTTPVKVKDVHLKEATTERSGYIAEKTVPIKLPLTWWEDFWVTSGKVGWGVIATIILCLIYKIIKK